MLLWLPWCPLPWMPFAVHFHCLLGLYQDLSHAQEKPLLQSGDTETGLLQGPAMGSKEGAQQGIGDKRTYFRNLGGGSSRVSVKKEHRRREGSKDFELGPMP